MRQVFITNALVQHQIKGWSKKKIVSHDTDLRTTLIVEGQDKLSIASLTLSHEKHAMAVILVLEDKLCGLHTRQCSVKPRVIAQMYSNTGTGRGTARAAAVVMWRVGGCC